VSQLREPSYGASRAASSRRPERRQSPRDGVRGEPSRARLVALMLGTYREMPRLSLTVRQAARLFGLRDVTCLAVLRDLVTSGDLYQTADSQYRVSAERV